MITSFRNKSVPNPLHVLEQNLLAASVIEFCRPAVGVASDSLSGFQSAVVFEKIRDAGRAEGMRRIMSWQSGLFESALQHVCGVSTHEWPTG